MLRDLGKIGSAKEREDTLWLGLNALARAKVLTLTRVIVDRSGPIKARLGIRVQSFYKRLAVGSPDPPPYT